MLNTQKTPEWLDWSNVCYESGPALGIRLRDYPGTSDLWHGHQGFGELVVVLGGHACNDYADQRERLNPGDIQVLPSGVVHRYSGIRTFRHYTIIWQDGFLEQLPAGFRALPNFASLFAVKKKPSPIFHVDGEILPTIIENLEAMRNEYLAHGVGWAEAVYIGFCRTVLLILRHAVNSGQSGGSGALFQIGRIIRQMEENPLYNYSIRSLSSAAAMSESSFRHHFRALTGLAPIDYLIRLRIQRAALLVAHTDNNISEIALQTGFTDGSYFARQFRYFFHMTAREFRKASRSGNIDLTEMLQHLKLTLE